MIIIDMGSGNTCANDMKIVERMIREVTQIDTHREEIVIKWQLFDSLGKNVPLYRETFAKAYRMAWGFGYNTTASVFDIPNLEFLVKNYYEIPFIKLANNPVSRILEKMIPEGFRVIKSVGSGNDFDNDCLCCVSKYPAKKEQYEKAFTKEQLQQGISDHTVNWDLYEKYKPELYEVHFCLEDSTGLDSGPFARRPKDLKEIL